MNTMVFVEVIVRWIQDVSYEREIATTFMINVIGNHSLSINYKTTKTEKYLIKLQNILLG